MNRVILASGCLIFVIITYSLGQTSTHPEKEDNCTELESEIISFALRHVHPDEHASGVLLMERTATKVPPGVGATTTVNIQRFLNSVPEDVRESFEIRSKIHAHLKPEQIRVEFALGLLSEQEALTIFRHAAGWQRLREKYPLMGSIVVVSLPGLNKAQDRALLYLGRSCGTLCGGGKLLYLIKTESHWTVVAETDNWLS